VGGVVVWLAGHAHLSCLNLRQWIAIGVDIHSFIDLPNPEGMVAGGAICRTWQVSISSSRG
jgi:hypothetical protein